MNTELLEDREIKGWHFEWNKEDSYYQCRGSVCYDEDHDEIPEQSLIAAAMQLELNLVLAGYDTDLQYGEKGYIYINI